MSSIGLSSFQSAALQPPEADWKTPYRHMDNPLESAFIDYLRHLTPREENNLLHEFLEQSELYAAYEAFAFMHFKESVA